MAKSKYEISHLLQGSDGRVGDVVQVYRDANDNVYSEPRWMMIEEITHDQADHDDDGCIDYVRIARGHFVESRVCEKCHKRVEATHSHDGPTREVISVRLSAKTHPARWVVSRDVIDSAGSVAASETVQDFPEAQDLGAKMLARQLAKTESKDVIETR